MSIDPEELLALPTDEKLRLIELLWDNIEESTAPISLPEATLDEIRRRRAELKADPSIALTHEELWSRIENRDR